MKARRSTVEIELNPYEDGCGQRHTVIAKRDGETIKVEIKQLDHVIEMSLDDWVAVRDNTDVAIRLAGGPDMGAGDMPGSAHVYIRNEK